MQKNRRIVTTLRWVMFLALAYLTTADVGSMTIMQAGLLAVVAFSNIALSRLPASLWEHQALLPVVALLDVAVLTSSMLGGQGFARDFFFAYFLVLAIVALAGGLKLSTLGTIAVVAGYGGYLALQVGQVLFHSPELIGRLGFLFSVGVGYAGLMETSRSRLRDSAMQGQLVGWVGRLSAAFSEDFDAIDVIHEVLVDIQKVYPGSTRASLVQVHSDNVRVIASGDDREVRDKPLSPDRYPELQQAIDEQRPVVINDIRTSKATESARGLVGTLPFTSLLLCPIDLQEETMGRVVLRIARKHGVFTPAMLAMTEHLARAIGVIFRQGKLREALERSEKMAMVSQVSSSVAHSFNGILSTVLLASEHLRKQVAEHAEVTGCSACPCDATSMQRFSEIELAIKEGLSIVERLNAWTRLDQGIETEEGTISVFDPRQLLRDAWSYAQPQWGRCSATRDLELVWDLAETAAVSGDRTELREVLLNLILNAVDAMPRGGTLTLRLAGGAERVRFIVEDTGVGIAEDQLERIFEPAFSTKGAAGTGLGLSVARSVAQRHQGYLTVHSEEGVGSRFTLELPASKEAIPPQQSDSPTSGRETAGGRYLLVDGNRLVRDVMTRFLQSTGFDVDVVGSDEEAVVMLGTMRPYSAVLADAGPAVEKTAAFVRALAQQRPDLQDRLLLYSTHAPNDRFLELQSRYGFHFVDRSAGLAALRQAITATAGDCQDRSDPEVETETAA